jgi:uncharacterized 2Fe-2S/4Fe-4S cluster protein (DUF4445 family)
LPWPDRCNAAGTGARITLLNFEARREIEEVVRRVEKIETAVESKFQEHFVNAMAFPHKFDPFLNLAKVVELPTDNSKHVDKDTNKFRKKRRRRKR